MDRPKRFRPSWKITVVVFLNFYSVHSFVGSNVQKKKERQKEGEGRGN